MSKFEMMGNDSVGGETQRKYSLDCVHHENREYVVYTNFEFSISDIERLSRVEGVSRVLGAGKYHTEVKFGKFFNYDDVLKRFDLELEQIRARSLNIKGAEKKIEKKSEDIEEILAEEGNDRGSGSGGVPVVPLTVTPYEGGIMPSELRWTDYIQNPGVPPWGNGSRRYGGDNANLPANGPGPVRQAGALGEYREGGYVSDAREMLRADTEVIRRANEARETALNEYAIQIAAQEVDRLRVERDRYMRAIGTQRRIEVDNNPDSDTPT